MHIGGPLWNRSRRIKRLLSHLSSTPHLALITYNKPLLKTFALRFHFPMLYTFIHQILCFILLHFQHIALYNSNSHMGISHRLCFLLILCLSIHFFMILVQRFFFMDRMESNLGCGFLFLGSFENVLKGLGFIVLFALGLQFLRINGCFFGFINFLCEFRTKSGVLSKGDCSKTDLDVKSNSKIAPLMYKLFDETKDNDNGAKIIDDVKHYESSDCYFGGKELYDEDMEFDVLKLRKVIKIEKGRADKACLDLEKERLAAATASEEAMSMILRLQTEKSLIELEAKQYRRLAEEKQLHNQEVIKSLQWLLLNHETERGLENQFSSCRQKLKVSPSLSDEGDHFENVLTTGISSLLHLNPSS